MTPKRLISAIALMLGAFICIGLYTVSAPETWKKYKYTQEVRLEFEYNNKTVTRSGFQNLIWKSNSRLGSVNGPAWMVEMTGYMPFIQLDDGGIVVALLIQEGSYTYIERIARKAGLRRGSDEKRFKDLIARAKLNEALDVSDQPLPLFAYFENPSDPQNYKIVEHEDLHSIEPSLSLKGMKLLLSPFRSVELKEIEKALPYLRDEKLKKSKLRAFIYRLNDNDWVPPRWIYVNAGR